MPDAAPSAREVILGAAFIYGNDDVSVTLPETDVEQEALLARSEYGAWVRIWVYVPYDAIEEEN